MSARPTPEQDVNLSRSVARTRLNIINELHATYGAECKRLRAEVRELKRRIRLARASIADFFSNTGDDLAAPSITHADDLLDLRKPLPKRRR